MTDCIFLGGMRFHAFHGLHGEERQFGRIFEVDLSCFLDTRPAGEADDPDRTACYGALFRLVHDVVTGRRFLLLEALAGTLAEEVLARFPLLEEVEVTVRKLAPPVTGDLGHAGVTISRRR